MKKILPGFVAALLLQAPLQLWAADAATPSDTEISKMQEQMSKMQEQMQKMQAEKKPEERQRLMKEHMETMHEHMQYMHEHMGGMGMMGDHGCMGMGGKQDKTPAKEKTAK